MAESLDLFSQLLQPIVHSIDRDDNSLRLYSSLYDDIKEARRFEDPLLYSMDESLLKKPDWSKVIELCVIGLKEQVKDWQLVFWMLEAYCEIENLKGIADSLEFFEDFLKKFWDDSLPHYPEDAEHRLNIFAWFEKKLEEIFYKLSLVSPVSLEDHSVSLQEWYLFKLNPKNFKKNEDFFITALKDTPVEWVQKQSDLVQKCKIHLTKIKDFLIEHCSKEDQAPTFLSVFNQFQIMEDYWSKVLKTAVIEKKENNKLELDKVDAKTDNFNQVLRVETMKRDQKLERDEIYLQIRHLSDRLKQLEPHSPTPYLLERMGTWENKNLKEILEEFSVLSLDIQSLMTFIGFDKTLKQ